MIYLSCKRCKQKFHDCCALFKTKKDINLLISRLHRHKSTHWNGRHWICEYGCVKCGIAWWLLQFREHNLQLQWNLWSRLAKFLVEQCDWGFQTDTIYTKWADNHSSYGTVCAYILNVVSGKYTRATCDRTKPKDVDSYKQLPRQLSSSRSFRYKSYLSIGINIILQVHTLRKIMWKVSLF